jgi:DNA-binding LacI/PurR family transcriptional regulator
VLKIDVIVLYDIVEKLLPDKRTKTHVTVTLKDVAQKAGVSVMTVSNVVHGAPHVTKEVRERVLAALEELNYQPNLPARYLRKRRVGMLALAIPDLSNPYFSEIGNAVIAAASTRSYAVLLDHTGGERANELLVINGLRPHLIDGVILSPRMLEPEDLQSRRVEIPLVLLSEYLFDVPYDNIAVDDVAVGRLATNHLLGLGRQRIAAIGTAEVRSAAARLRLQGYTEALRDAGKYLEPQLIVPIASYHRNDGAQAMRYLLTLNPPPDAVFCFNDLLALGAMHTLREAGWRIPDDVAVIGVDDLEESRFVTPSLTTIAEDKERIGELAVSFLLGRIDGTRTGPPERVEVPFRLIVRQSTGV